MFIDTPKRIIEKKCGKKGSGGSEFQKYNSRLFGKGKVKSHSKGKFMSDQIV
jgi:hypothetical protein